jgi:hypothetical protein
VTGAWIFLFATTSRLAVVLIHSPTWWVLGVLSLELQQAGHEAEHSPASSVEIKSVWRYTSVPLLICLNVIILIKKGTTLVIYFFTFNCLMKLLYNILSNSNSE